MCSAPNCCPARATQDKIFCAVSVASVKPSTSSKQTSQAPHWALE